MAERKVLRIDAMLAEFAGELEIDGQMHQVRQMTFGMHQWLDTASSADSVKTIRNVVEAVVPTLSIEQINKLSIEAARGITTLAGAGIEAVERLFPNAVSPASTISPG